MIVSNTIVTCTVILHDVKKMSSDDKRNPVYPACKFGETVNPAHYAETGPMNNPANWPCMPCGNCLDQASTEYPFKFNSTHTNSTSNELNNSANVDGCFWGLIQDGCPFPKEWTQWCEMNEEAYQKAYDLTNNLTTTDWKRCENGICLENYQVDGTCEKKEWPTPNVWKSSFNHYYEPQCPTDFTFHPDFKPLSLNRTICPPPCPKYTDADSCNAVDGCSFEDGKCYNDVWTW